MHIRRPPPLRVPLTMTLLALAAAGCDDLLRQDPSAPEAVLVRLADEEAGKSFRVGYPIHVYAFVSDEGGLGVGEADVRWVVPEGSGSVQPAGERTNGNGFLEAVWTPGTQTGTQEIRVELVGEGASDTIPTIRFYPDTVVGAVELATEVDNLVEGEQTTVSVTRAADRFGNEYVLRGGSPFESPPPITFVSLDPEILSLTVQGPEARVISLAPGTGRVAVTSGGKADTVEITVSKFVPPGSFRVVSGGAYFTCGASPTGAAFCWGDNGLGQLGDGSGTPSAVPVAVSALAGVNVTELGTGDTHACALSSDGDVWCWGDNGLGQLGDGTFDPRPTPVKATRPDGVTYTAVGAGFGHTCALSSAGDAWCWGDNGLAQLGNGDASGTPSADPVPVDVPAGVSFAQLSVGAAHACGLTAAGAAWCWGFNGNGQVGNGSFDNAVSAVPVAPGTPFASLGLGYVHSCGIGTDGAARCWGDNSGGQLGDGTRDPRAEPVAVGGLPAVAGISGGLLHSCAVTADGRSFCWGENVAGRLGNGTEDPSDVPVEVASGAIRFTSLNLGNEHGCAVGTDQEAYCWGTNFAGELGTGEVGTPGLAPARVVTPLAPSGLRAQLRVRAAQPIRRPAWCAELPRELRERARLCR